MFFLTLLIAAATNYFLWTKGSAFDAWVNNWLLQQRAKGKRAAAEIRWMQYIISGLRTGTSLQEILSLYGGEDFSHPHFVAHSNAALSGRPSSDPVAQLLAHSLQHGSPCLEPLRSAKDAATARLRSDRKLQAATAQARAQAWVAAAIPWLLLIAFFQVDRELVATALATPLPWALLALAFLLDLTGLAWIHRSMRHAFAARSAVEREIEQFLPDFLQQLRTQIAIGLDPGSAWSESLRLLPSTTALWSWLQPSQPLAKRAPAEIRQLRSLLERATAQGAPLRAELRELQEELADRQQSRWEEATQLLPMKLLAPLFLCIFPSTILVLLCPLLPALVRF